MLEAFYYRKPVLVNRYSTFVADIEPKGARVIAMDGYLTKDVVLRVSPVCSQMVMLRPRSPETLTVPFFIR